MTLSSLCSQTFNDFSIVISDQSDEPVEKDQAVLAVSRVLKHHGNDIKFVRNLPRQGMAQQRQCLLDHAFGRYGLFLDDDVLLEPWSLEVMVQTMKQQQCGLTGMFVIGLSFKGDRRPYQQKLEFWEEPVKPEKIRPGSSEWERAAFHNAANVLHVAENLNLSPHNRRIYKVAWIGACKLYNLKKLRTTGGFHFWRELPTDHVGEDVLAQLQVLEEYGGCGILPSGAYHQELTTTIPVRKVNAVGLLQDEEQKEV